MGQVSGPLSAIERAAADRGGGSSLPPAIEFRRISKSFPGQLAVDDVSFSVMPGEIHALVGENGAGKTTLIKILVGNHHADEGEILLGGASVRIDHPDHATRLGIGVIHQEPALFPTLSVAENLAIGWRFTTRAPWVIDWQGQRDAVRPVLEMVGLKVDPGARLSDLTTHQRQLVALARVLLQDRRVVVLDEITAPLTQAEVQRLFAILRHLRQRGVAIIYVSHRLHEIFELADRVTVMRNGRWIATRPVSGLAHDELTRLIIGSDPASRFSPGRSEARDTQPVLSVRELSDDVLSVVSFDLHAGEVLGLAGLAGAGRTNVLESIFGLRRPHGGRVEMGGRDLRPGSPADAIANGIALVTEDRQVDGYIPTFSLAHNLSLPWLRLFTRHGMLRLGQERRAARKAVERFDIRTRSVEARMSELSGGNQQRAILARWLSHPVRVLLLDEPTHGVDIGAKARIYEIIRSIAAEGAAVVLVSSELEELEGLCSRVLLLSEGRIVGEQRAPEVEKGRMLSQLYQAMSAIPDAA